jgi:hypothetical protein
MHRSVDPEIARLHGLSGLHGGMEEKAPYFLSRQAHLCVAGDAVFLLDLATGKYLSIDKGNAAGLGGRVLGWPIESDGSPAPAVLQSLLDRRLITADPKRGKPATSCAIDRPAHWLREGQPRGRPAITATDVRRFAASVAYAAFSKKVLPFRYTVSRVQRSKRVQQGRPIDTARLASLVGVFDWLRPLGFKKTDECFLYCLALSEFLSKYGIHPAWVFAVRAEPFAAHCWLQHEDHVLTDIPFNLRRMVPILVL